MSVLQEHTHGPDQTRGPSRAAASFLMFALMVLSSVSVFSGESVSDPVVTENPDDTCTVTWDFDDPAGYEFLGTGLSGGDAVLEFLNETDGDHTAEDYSQGTVVNMDLTSIPGSAIIGTGGPDETLVLQPGPEGIDAYISEVRATDNYGSTANLFIDSESGKAMRILMWFDVSAVPKVAKISDATLWLYEQSGSRGSDVVVDIYTPSIEFVESEVTWTQSQEGITWVSPGGDYGTHSYGSFTVTNQFGWVGFEITELVESWTDGSVSNNGFIMVPEEAAGDNQKVFQSSDESDPQSQNPKLVVNYSMSGDAGMLESRVLGPGTNATFTFASFTASAVSRLDDDFSGTAALPDWLWRNEPLAYDINDTREGWLHVRGSPSTVIHDSTVTCNFMYQFVAGDFSASTYLEDSFSESSMGAGLLILESDTDWVYVAKAQHTTNSRIQVVVCQSGASTLAAELVWPLYSSAHLRAERNSTGVWLYASTNGVSYALVYHYVPWYSLANRLEAGLFVYSDSTSSPEVEFDHFTVAYFEEPTLEVRVRFGNSTSLSDESWEDWDSAPLISGPVTPGETGKYLQYQVSMYTPEAWYTPVFSGFDCWYEMYAPSGTMRTLEHVPADFSKWIGIVTDETENGGTVGYWYSTDGGDTWLTAGSGGSYSISSTVPSLRIRVDLYTPDTLRSPMVHSVLATHVTAVSYLVIEAPDEVVAGQSFPVTITVKDGSDTTMVHWTGGLTLTAVELDGATPTGTALSLTEAYITASGAGSVTVPNEQYTEAGTIIIRVEAADAYGLSSPITVLPGTIASLSISPTVNVLLEGAQQMFTCEARDIFLNTITDMEYTWSVEGGIGTLDTYDGTTVVMTAGEAGTDGYLNVSAGGFTASLEISVTYTANAPVFEQEVPDQTEYEDAGSWTIDLADCVHDDVHSDNELRWFITGEDVVDVSGENRTGNLVITLSTILNRAGTDQLTLYVVDPDGLYSTTTFSVKIEAVNDWPVISTIDPLYVHYDVLYIYNIKYYIEDVDNAEDDLSMWVDDESSAYVEVQDLALQITYPAALNGTTQSVVVTVSDGEATASTAIRVTVSDNTVPVLFDAIPGVDMNQGEALLDVFDLDDHFADPDGGALYYSYWYSHVLVNVSAEHEVSFFAPADWYGTEYVIFSATDEEGARAESVATVVVHRVNQAPSIEGVPDLVVKHDLEYRFDLTWYVSDPDDDVDDLYVTTDDVHVVPAGLVLTLEYPADMSGTYVYVTITVSDGELSDSCTVKVTIGDNAPPTADVLPTHSFQEDLPQPYPASGGLDGYFDDEDGDELTYEAFSLTPGVNATAYVDLLGVWTVEFTTDPNWNGYAWFVVRATDAGGALVETAAEVTVHSVPDAPVLEFNETIEVHVGVQRALDLYAWASDPDLHAQGLEFVVSGEYSAYATVIEGVLVLEFPAEFLDRDEERRTIAISMSVSDPDGLHDADALSVVVVGEPVDGEGTWLLIGMLAMAGVAAGSFVVALRLRKRPFVIKDIMVIHNDGFLIGRAAAKTEGEIDEDILSGMLTAVLNFVEDSMAKTQDGLKSFGFEHYKVLVRRGKMTYIAVVYEGDAPLGIEGRLGEFLAKIEKIYRKRIESWTGDMDTDFAGIEVLLQAFVKENGRKSNGLNGGPTRPDEDQ